MDKNGFVLEKGDLSRVNEILHEFQETGILCIKAYNDHIEATFKHVEAEHGSLIASAVINKKVESELSTLLSFIAGENCLHMAINICFCLSNLQLDPSQDNPYKKVVKK